MADMNLPQKSGKRKVQAPRIDLTPMVDLGFLLITFFIFTTTMAKAHTMELNMPYKTDQRTTAFTEESTLTLVPTAKRSVVYYEGAFHPDKKAERTAVSNIRQLLLAQQKKAAALPNSFSPEAHLLHVVIKPAPDCTYEDVINILDEMNILDIRYYALDDISIPEKEWME
ncbi:MAG: biopolymer transporter ExbD [Flavipsychrobacter sp.]|nr:biopolymer transporter ExbD [Flavipsychrobacter sp.]